MAAGYTIALDSSTIASQPEGTGGSAAHFTFDITTNAAADQTVNYELWNVTTGTAVPASLATDFATAYSGTTTVLGTTAIAGGATATQLSFTAAADSVADGNQSYQLWVWTSGTSNTTHAASTPNVTVIDDDATALGITTANRVNAAENQTAVETVTATGATGTYTYSLTGAGADHALFHIDATTGALTFLTAPDAEAGTGHGTGGVNDYLVQVAVDSSGAHVTQDLTVHVSNVDDVAPTITGGAAASYSIAENTQLVHTATIATSDPASTANTWSISGGADSSLFTINSTTGDLSFTTAPDFEHGTGHGADTDHYLVQVKLTDSASLSATQNVTVAVTDVAEPATITSYSAQSNVFVHEHDGTTSSTVVAHITATNDDQGATPTLSLVGADAGDFSISGSGDVTFVSTVDFTAPADANGDNTYNFTVKAHTGQGDALQNFFVTIDDPNPPTSGGGGGGGGTAPYSPHVIIADDLGDSIAAGAQDTVGGGAGGDSIDGGSGDNVIFGEDGNDVVRGFSGNDSIDGGDGNDDVNGNMGNDTVLGGNGADTVRGGQDNDSVYGGAGDDPHVNGNIGDDIVHGDDGNDTVYGGQGNDTVYGDAGNDSLSGDLGNDVMFGGAGADRFGFAVGGGHDWVGDFSAAEGDHVVLATGTAYTVSNYAGQVMITLSSGDSIGLANVPYASFSSDWISFA